MFDFRMNGEAPWGPIGPALPLGPVGPVRPRGPVGPWRPMGPCEPVLPRGPCGPAAPVSPFWPFGPIGPSIVLHDDLGDPQNLTIQTRLNGDVVQDSNTRNMIFPIAETIAFISKQITLEEGDIIATGTPDGVGPLKNGDVVEVEIEGVGVLRNKLIGARK